MKIYVYPADRTGCGYYRAIWPAKALIAQGHDIVIVPPNAGVFDMKVETHRDKVTAIQYPEDADVIVMQRVMHYWIAKAIPVLRSLGVAVVIDNDDDLEAIHPAHPAFPVLHPKYNALYNWNIAREAAQAATLSTVSTQPLTRLYTPTNGNIRIIKNTVPQQFLDLQPIEGPAVVGWMGSVHSHPDDLQAMGQSPARLAREGVSWKFVGPDRGIQEALRFDTTPFATGYAEMEDIMPLIASTINVGVAPLQDTRFNRAKSWLKQLEYASLGVPSVCSDVPEYRELAQRTGALLAKNQKDWYQKVKRLVRDDDFRISQGAKARRAASHLTIEEHAGDWLKAWLEAYRLQQTRVTIGR
jgi:glycosyltransferase involved in cell wall biosynthesis